MIANKVSSTNYSISGLNSCSTYSFYVTAYKGDLESDGSNTASAKTSGCSSGAPSAPSLSSPGNGQVFGRYDAVNLVWNSNGSYQYLVEFWGMPDNGMSQLPWQTGTSLTIGGGVWGGTYSWHVKARNSSGQVSDWGETRTFFKKYGTPNNVHVSATSDSQAHLTWDQDADAPGNIEGYKIYRDGQLRAIAGSSATSFDDYDLNCNSSYSYYLKAYKGSGESDASSTVSMTTNGCPPPPPSANFDAWPLSGTAPLVVAMHIVDTSNMTNCSWDYGDGQTGTSCASSHDHIYNDYGTYTVQLSVHGPGGDDSMVRTDYIIVSNGAPSTPSNLRVSGTTQNSITIAWDDVNYEDGYKIYKWGSLNGAWDFYYLTSVGANVTNFTDSPLQCGGVGYFYQVSAYNSQGESSRAGWVQGTTAACPIPDTPFNFRVSDTTYNSITLAWDDVNYEDGYKIYKWDYLNGAWDFYYLTSVGANVTNFTDSPLQCGGVGYFYQVSAYNSQGESSRAGWVQGTTAACPIPDTPSNFRVSDTTYNSFTLAWDDVNYEDGYKIYKWDYLNGAWDFYYLTSVGANVTNFTDTPLQCGAVEYFYQVSAYNFQGESSRAGWVQGNTAACPAFTLTVSKIGPGSGSVISSPDGINCGTICTYDFNYNAAVTLTATPIAPSTFSGWSGAGCSGTGTCTVSMSSVQSITATFNSPGSQTLTVSKSGTGSGTVTTNPAGIDCGLTCLANFTYNTSVTLTAAAITGSTFTGWSGSGCTGIGACILTMDAAKSVTATFMLNTYALSVSKSGTGNGTVTSNPAGIDCGSTCSANFTYNTSVTLTAAAITGSTFTGWSGSGCTGIGACILTMDAAKSVTAIFILNTYALSVSKSGTGNGTVTSNPAGIDCGSTCSANFNYNSSVTLTVAAITGSTFTGWSGSGCTGIGACTVTMEAAKSVTATFMLNTYPLSVNKSGTGSGTVTSNPAGIDCGSTCSANFNYNSSVTLTAAAITGSTFTGWSGSGCAGLGTCTVMLDAAKSVTAIFILNTYALSVSKSGIGSGTVTSDPAGIDCGLICSYSFANNTVVTLTATPIAPSTFVGWSGGGCSGTDTCTIILSSAKSVTAYFFLEIYPIYLPLVSR
jgi:PKD repeat protein/uncharacterized protein (DUF2141 family)